MVAVIGVFCHGSNVDIWNASLYFYAILTEVGPQVVLKGHDCAFV